MTYISRRELVEDEFGNVYEVDNFWYSSTGFIVKWAIFLSILGILVIWILGGYVHACLRLKKGLPPLSYHRWLLPRSERTRFELNRRYVYQQPIQPNQDHILQTRSEPPPLYSRYALPDYYPPADASKHVSGLSAHEATQESQHPSSGPRHKDALQAPRQARTRLPGALRFLRR